jgi:hypothetical protein
VGVLKHFPHRDIRFSVNVAAEHFQQARQIDFDFMLRHKVSP